MLELIAGPYHTQLLAGVGPPNRAVSSAHGRDTGIVARDTVAPPIFDGPGPRRPLARGQAGRMLGELSVLFIIADELAACQPGCRTHSTMSASRLLEPPRKLLEPTANRGERTTLTTRHGTAASIEGFTSPPKSGGPLGVPQHYRQCGHPGELGGAVDLGPPTSTREIGVRSL